MTFDADNRDVVAAYRASAETFLVIELADASLRYDQQSKIPVYAVARINEVWIVGSDPKTAFTLIETRER
jgi:hypothetical protein